MWSMTPGWDESFKFGLLDSQTLNLGDPFTVSISSEKFKHGGLCPNFARHYQPEDPAKTTEQITKRVVKLEL